MSLRYVTTLWRRVISTVVAVTLLATTALAQDADVAMRLAGFDEYVAKVMKDWNAPGVAVGVVVDGKLVFAKGYGYRDKGKRLPLTPKTVMPIASNTKLFTAVATGMLVEEGKLTWDKPVRDSVPSIRFFSDQLTDQVTLRDMLSHRTGVAARDGIWIGSDSTRKELFDKLAYLEPEQPLRQSFIYNNLMFSAAGYMVELQSGKTWESFVRERIFDPLKMASTSSTIADMLKQPEFGVGYMERRDSSELFRLPAPDVGAAAPAGGIVSNITDMSHWLIALMNDGKYQGSQVLPPAVLRETLHTANTFPNSLLESNGWGEMLNDTYGMANEVSVYRGHLLAWHGGDLTPFHSQVSFMPQDHIGVVVFDIGNTSSFYLQLSNVISYSVYERLLGLSLTPWSERLLEIRTKSKEAGREERLKAAKGRIRNTVPSHALADYAGVYDNPAYGPMTIRLQGQQLQIDFRNTQLPLMHFHFDRFDSADNEETWKASVNFRTNWQGKVNEAVVSLDDSDVVFGRKLSAIGAQ